MTSKRKFREPTDAENVFGEEQGKPNYLVGLDKEEDEDEAEDESDIEIEGESADEDDDAPDSLDELYDDDEEDEGTGNTEEEEEVTTDQSQEKKTSAVKQDVDSGIDDPPQQAKVKKKQASKGGKVLVIKPKQDSDKAAVGSSGVRKEEAAGASGEDEYREDSSDEEDLRNTIGNVPMKWYDDFEHVGYDVEGNKIQRPVRGDKLDEFLNRMENPDFNRTVLDKQTGQDVRLNDEDLGIVKRLMNSCVPEANYDMYAPWIDHFTHEVMEMPLSGRPEHKRSIVRYSKNEERIVARMAEIIKKGHVGKPPKETHKYYTTYDIWKETEGEHYRGIHNHLPAPKVALPGHGQSYNPPPEYRTNPHRKPFRCLRAVPGYEHYIRERYERCLDLYIAPRKRVLRVKMDSKDLIPVLPKPEDLRPFPSKPVLEFKGHRSIIRTISVHPQGKFMASGSDDQTVKIWEVSTGRCLRSFDVEGAVKWVTWNPCTKLFLLGVVVNWQVIFLNPESYLTEKTVVKQTNAVFTEEPDQGDYIQPERVKTAVTWRKATADEWAKGYRVVIDHFREVTQIVWHKQGDYFATMLPRGDHRSVLMHQLSRWRTQVPFNKCKGLVQAVEFHPKLPLLYVATQGHIRVYNLQKQIMLKKVQANCRWISSIAVHPGGEHFLIGGYDRKVNWFEMEYTKRPHVLRYHKEAVRSVAFHRKYPLFASASDDGRVVVTHGMVYNDWLKDPFIVPLKELRGHAKFDDLCVLSLAWHPYEPFLFTAGADSKILLWN